MSSANRLFDITCDRSSPSLFESISKGRLLKFDSASIDAQSDRLATLLIEVGLPVDGKVVTLLQNGPLWNIAECAILKIGCVHAPLTMLTGSTVLRQMIQMLKPSAVIVDSDTAKKAMGRILDDADQLIDLRSLDLSSSSSEISLAEVSERKQLVEATDTAVILFTSGSTSSPKGVLLSHRNILVAAEEFGNSDSFRGVRRTLSILPMSHSAARKVNYACQLRGITVCYAAPSLSLLHNLRRFRSEHVALVPFLLEQLRQQIEKNIEMPLVLQKISCGGASLSASLWKWFNDREFHVYEVYGLTETASLLSYSTDKCRRPNCVGLTACNIETRNAENGELEVRGPTVLKTYLMEDGSLKRAVDDDGWFRTGDVVVSREDGGVEIHGRLKRSYKTQRGNYIYPEQVERMLSSISGVIHAQMVNEPSDSIAVVLVTRSESDTEMIQQTIHNHNRTANEDLKIIKIAFLTSEFKRESTSVEMFKPNKQFINSYLSQIEFQTI